MVSHPAETYIEVRLEFSGLDFSRTPTLKTLSYFHKWTGLLPMSMTTMSEDIVEQIHAG